MTLEQVAEMKPTYQKQKGHKNLVLMPQVTFEVTSYQATCLPNLSTQNNKSQSTLPSQHVHHLLLINI
jgi:PHD/YefM family antitoxin component YafN of YafNO toxin-antitoxin module